MHIFPLLLTLLQKLSSYVTRLKTSFHKNLNLHAAGSENQDNYVVI
jgi:hypothetical protein